MSDEKNQELKDLQLKFVAKILASFTHEMKNHLAIIKESGGLIQDLVAMGKKPKKKDAEVYLSSLQLIDDQVKKSIDVIDVLNRFAHRMDHPACSFLINDAVEELIVLMQRIANRKRISLQKDFRTAVPAIIGDPSMLQFLIHCLLEEMLYQLDASSRIVFSTSFSKDSVSIRLAAHGRILEGPREDAVPSPDSVQQALRGLNGTLSRADDHKEATIRLPAPQASIQD